MNQYEIGQRVQVDHPGLREHGSSGVVLHYDTSTQWHTVELTRERPPFRGKYTANELVSLENRTL